MSWSPWLVWNSTFESCASQAQMGGEGGGPSGCGGSAIFLACGAAQLKPCGSAAHAERSTVLKAGRTEPTLVTFFQPPNTSSSDDSTTCRLMVMMITHELWHQRQACARSLPRRKGGWAQLRPPGQGAAWLEGLGAEFWLNLAGGLLASLSPACCARSHPPTASSPAHLVGSGLVAAHAVVGVGVGGVEVEHKHEVA